MKKWILYGLLITAVSTKAGVQFEGALSKWIDSTFLAEGVNWNSVQNDFISLGQQNFKNCQTIDDFILSLEGTASKKAKNDKELNLAGFEDLKAFSVKANSLFEKTFQFVDHQVYQMQNLCEMTGEIEMYLDMFYFTEINLVGIGRRVLIPRILEMTVFFTDQELYKKFISLVLVQNVFEAKGISREERLNEVRSGIQIIKGKSSKNKGGSEAGPDESDPCFLGGDAGMRKFIIANVSYPEICREMGEQGKVFVQFVVDRDGSIGDIAIVKSSSDLLSKEAIRVVMLMPKWKPGYQNGEPVRIRYTLPMNFSIG